jgi:hypothetical protein
MSRLQPKFDSYGFGNLVTLFVTIQPKFQPCSACGIILEESFLYLATRFIAREQKSRKSGTE